MTPTVALLAAAALAIVARADDWWYRDFNSTAGLRFNGVAGTSSCNDGAVYNYSVVHGGNDGEWEAERVFEQERGAPTDAETTVDTASKEELQATTRRHAVYPHALSAGTAPTGGCPVRLRLTPSRPNLAGSVFRQEPQPMLNGFETGFTFQITDASRQCRQVKDRAFSTAVYQSCAVQPGDGFALVLHHDMNASSALGGAAEGIGYAGIANALAIEFDTFPNLGTGTGDIPQEHISVQAPLPPTPAAGAVLTATVEGQVAGARAVPLADGLVHRVRIVYYRHLVEELVPYFSAKRGSVRLMRDEGEGRRLGTLVVYLDDLSVPVVVTPMNLNSALDLHDNQAYVGFTSSTGMRWAKHDVLDWYYCEQPGCPLLTGDPAYLLFRPDL